LQKTAEDDSYKEQWKVFSSRQCSIQPALCLLWR